MNIIKNGYTLPFENGEFPPPFFAKNNASALKHKAFVEKSIKELLENKCIKEVKSIPHCVNPLTVAAKDEKLRLVLDLRHVNNYVKVDKFRYENLKTASEFIEKDDFFGTFDLKSGYHHISIAEEYQKYLGFSWTYDDGTTKFYEFLVLPFGL